MLPGDMISNMQMLGLILMQKNQESVDEKLPHVGVSQKKTNAIAALFLAVWGHRSEINLQVVALSDANQALEARVLELERQLTMISAELR